MSSPKPTNSSLPSWPIIPMPLSLQQQLEQDQRRRLESSSAEIVTTLHDRDVLLGRGASSDRFAGNVAFRQLIRAKKAAYTAAPTRHKKRIAEDIVDAIEAAGGRFLRRRTGETTSSAKPSGGSKREDTADDNGNDSHDNHLPTWSVATYEVAVEKVKQALRDTSEKKKVTALGVVGSAMAVSLPVPLQDEAAAAASAALSLAHFGQGDYGTANNMLSINPPAARRVIEREPEQGHRLLDQNVSLAPWNTERYNHQQTQQQQQQQPQHVDEITLIRDLLAMRAARAAAAAATDHSSSTTATATLGFPNSTSTAHSRTTNPFESLSPGTAAAPEGWYPNRHNEGDAFRSSLPATARQQWPQHNNRPIDHLVPSSSLWSATASTASATAAPSSTCPESFTSSSLVHSALLQLQQRRRQSQEEEDQQQLRLFQEMSSEQPTGAAPAIASFPSMLPNSSTRAEGALPDSGGTSATTNTAKAATAATMTMTSTTDNVEPLDAATTLQVLAAWREIPGNYIHMLSSTSSMSSPSRTDVASATAPFTSRDWQIVRLVQALAESHQSATCLEQVHLLMDVVARLPSSQRQLPPRQVHELVQALVRRDDDHVGFIVPPPGRGDVHRQKP